MVNNKMEMSLEDIIKQDKPMRRRGRGGGIRGGVQKRRANNVRRGGMGRGNFGGRRTQSAPSFPRGDMSATWQHDLYDFGGKKANLGAGRAAGGGGLAAAAVGAGPIKLFVSNLDFGVSDSDILELFGEIGPLRSASVHYDRSGRSLGTADVIYERKNDAVKAMRQYNGIPLDGRPMNIQMPASDVSPVQKAIQTARLGGGGGFGGGRRVGGGGGGGRFGQRRGGGARGGRRGGGAGGRGGQARKTPTAEQLDAELEEYISSK